ncbi:DUF2231 domain-containing protein [Rhodococcus sp. NPDC058505]|uniref:DUF2231 domain-containing protein n=1 Tax=unclassified Rhodococcus (in: high G+C Gram-positive bacteria) TaxID=192944 RepID=UPI0036674E36
MSIDELLRAPERATGLDRVAVPLHRRLTRVADRNPAAAAVLRGRWVGHPVHPAVVALPVGAWTAAVVLEMVLRDHHAARRLIGLGLVCVPVAVATGWADWSVRDERDRRAGLVHAAGNTLGTLAMLRSYLLRSGSAGARAQAWSVAGLAVVGVSGTLGGHIAFGGGSA